MITISLCMIVKNEEKVLDRCLAPLVPLVDEIIIADTGSTDRTKEIALRYTDKVYDYQWENDFSKARNFVFSKATMDYIYSADADEILDEENRKRFRILKEAMLPEIDIVQMYYVNQLSHNTVYNYDKEYRPKLFKRIRTFQWIDPIHETIRTEPVIFDSDIEILHCPEGSHAGRDLDALFSLWQKGEPLSRRLREMYARELMIAGTESDFAKAAPAFQSFLLQPGLSVDEIKEACCILAFDAFYEDDLPALFTNVLKVIAADGCSEICCLLGDYYSKREEWDDAVLWYQNAAYETAPILNIQYKEAYPLKRLSELKQKHLPSI